MTSPYQYEIAAIGTAQAFLTGCLSAACAILQNYLVGKYFIRVRNIGTKVLESFLLSVRRSLQKT